MRSLKTKLILIYSAVVLVVMSVSGTFMLYSVRNMEIEQTHNALRSHAEMINDQIVQLYDKDDFSAAWDSIVWLSTGQSEIEGVILGDMGLPLAPHEFVASSMRFNDRSLVNALTGNEFFNVGSVGINLQGEELQWFTFAMPVTSGNEDFIVYTRLNMRFINESISRLTLTLVTTVLVALVVTLVFWFFVGSTTITNPIVALTQHTKAIASGDFSHEITVSSDDEIGQLAHDFNNMSKELKATLSRMASESNKIEALFKNTSHGVLVYDVTGQLIHANNACGELLNGMDLNNASVKETFRFFGFEPEDVFQLSAGEVRESVHEDEDSFLYATVTTYTGETGKTDGFVIVIQDITRQQKLDNMRKEFVANVSHELRTPLTNVKTYAETLLDGALDDRETAMRFLKVIDDEADRMSFLVSDLLELSRIDSKQLVLETEAIDLVALLRLAIRQAQIPAEQKSQKIEFVPPKNVCFIEANASRINQVITNILSNSIKYSPENTTIRITMEATEKYFRVFIKDQGMGIPQESLTRIFERFYRVDKARSRSLGGTGLGLAIVKEIMEEHGGKVSATSKLGQGTTMVLRFRRLDEYAR
ncbi:MAG: cell wall metabolism sensor histidine kinase WalK [Defluviitaleaceae bacterium]|nr:cell wall metabolism sensor histidine kinase WalK [Defluviitaleaceae bacterium]